MKHGTQMRSEVLLNYFGLGQTKASQGNRAFHVRHILFPKPSLAGPELLLYRFQLLRPSAELRAQRMAGRVCLEEDLLFKNFVGIGLRVVWSGFRQFFEAVTRHTHCGARCG